MKGRVTYQDFEGGFWGITGEDGGQYLPVDGLPSDVRKDGLDVQFDFEPASGASVMMWGRPVKLRSIEVLTAPSNS
jgi:hypothetical protein